MVLRREIYAVAALLGAVAVAVLHRLDAAGPVALWAAAALVFGVRPIALRRGWSAPTPAGGTAGD